MFEKNWNEMLGEIRNKDQVVTIKAKIKLLAQQDPLYAEMKDAPLKVPVEELDAYETQSTEKVEEGTKTKKKTERVRMTNKKITKKPKALFHKFERENGGILLPLGGSHGIIHRDLDKVMKAMKKSGYKYTNSLNLIQVFPDKVNIGKKKIKEDYFLVPRNGRMGQKTRVLEGFEYIDDVTAEFKIRICSECPLTENEIVALFHGLEGLKGFGPAQRGRIEILELN